MRLSGAAFFSLALAVVAAYAVYTALRWPPKAALFPLTMGIPLLVLALAQTLVELRDPATPVQPPGARAKTFTVFAWMATFIMLVLLAGFPIAVPLFVFSYLVMESREGAGLSIALAAVAWGVFHLLFERLLHFPFEAGLIGSWF
ncbi:MAG TPA: tripartite tricarboxylate transporter TctB family protein [Burkholderiales bacterium]|nr:tripartite tricarboxylate transporter TctB family protein [Burkholderiales bacterium]